MLWWFLRITDYGVEEFLYTATLSQNMSVGPSIGTLNILNLCHSAFTISAAWFNTVNYDPNVEVLYDFFLLLNHMIGALLQNINIPVWDILVAFSKVWLVLTNQFVVVTLPRGFGASAGNASSAYL